MGNEVMMAWHGMECNMDEMGQRLEDDSYNTLL